MIKFVSNLLVALLITGSTFSQNTYPQLVLPGKTVLVRDTMVLITLGQMDAVNNAFILSEQLQVTVDTLQNKLINCKEAFTLFHKSDSISKAQLSILQSSSTEKDIVINTLKDADKAKSRKIKKLKLTNQILLPLAGVETVILITFLLLL